MLSTSCPHCGMALAVPANAQGRTGRCSRCKQTFTIQLGPLQPEPRPAAEEVPYAVAPAGEDEGAADTEAVYEGCEVVEEEPEGWAETKPPAPVRRSARPAPTAAGLPDDQNRPRKDRRPAPLPSTVDVQKALTGPERKRSSRRKRSKTSIGTWITVVLGGVILIGGFGLVLWLVRPGGTLNNAAPTPPSGPVLEPRAGTPDSWVSPSPTPSARAWKVTPDPVAPPSGLLSAFPLVAGDVKAVAFAMPAEAKAAVVHATAKGLEWVRYDLRKTEPTGRMPLAMPEKEIGNVVAALSPSGDRLACAISADPPAVVVWSAEGKELARVACSAKEPPRWIGLADETRLLVFGGGKLTGHDLPSGKVAFTIALKAGPVLSPGRKWLAAFTGTGFEWFATADGSSGGTLPLPEGWYDPKRQYPGAISATANPTPALAIHPDGQLAAGLAFGLHRNLLIAVWDLRSGAGKEAMVLPLAHIKDQLSVDAVWCSDRRLLLASGQLVDLDLHTWISSYTLGDTELCTGPRPDTRCWRLAELTADEADRAAAKPALAAQAETLRRHRLLLAATTLPDSETTAALATAAQHGLLWHPGIAVRIEVVGDCPASFRDTAIGKLANGLSIKGYRIDPAAKVTVQVAGNGGNREQTDVKPINGTWAEYQRNTYYVLQAWLEVRPQGRGVLLHTDRVEVSIKAWKSQFPELDGWTQVMNTLWNPSLPRLALVSADETPLALPEMSRMGIDDILDAPPIPKPRPKTRK